MTGQPEAITEAELRAAIDRLGWYMQREPGGGPATHPADRIIRDVERHREPGYEPGGVYRDADGDVFKYCNELAGDTPWLGFTGELYAHGHVSQPLHKMVPEGSPLADSERDLIRRDLGRLLDLLGLGGFARPSSSHECSACASKRWPSWSVTVRRRAPVAADDTRPDIPAVPTVAAEPSGAESPAPSPGDRSATATGPAEGDWRERAEAAEAKLAEVRERAEFWAPLEPGPFAAAGKALLAIIGTGEEPS